MSEKKRILVVEDDAALLPMISYNLQKNGFSVKEATNGEEALLLIKEEIPSLDKLQANPELDKIKIFAINIGKENSDKVNKFFKDFNIKNFDPYFDPPTTLAKMFSLRGVPTTILINKEGQEFARIMGSIDFEDKNFVNWIKKYN